MYEAYAALEALQEDLPAGGLLCPAGTFPFSTVLDMSWNIVLFGYSLDEFKYLILRRKYTGEVRVRKPREGIEDSGYINTTTGIFIILIAIELDHGIYLHLLAAHVPPNLRARSYIT